MGDNHQPWTNSSVHDTIVLLEKVQQLERDNAGLKAELTGYMVALKLVERDRAELRNKVADLENQTQWLCTCGGTDFEGQKENAALREDKERLEWLLEHLFITRAAIDADRKEAKP